MKKEGMNLKEQGGVYGRTWRDGGSGVVILISETKEKTKKAIVVRETYIFYILVSSFVL